MRFLLTIIKRLLLFVSICIGAMVLLEGSLRIAFINRSADVPLVIEKEVSDYVLRGHSTVSLRPGESKDGNWKVNKEGFRGPELSLSDNYRVMVYGDEMVHTGHIAYENTIGPVLSSGISKSLGKDFIKKLHKTI